MKLLYALPLFTLVAGCVGTGNVPPVQYYVLGDGEQSAVALRASETRRVLLVNPTTVSAFYDTQRLAYSRAEGQRAYYQFAAWTERPGRALSELLMLRLGASSTTSGVKGDLVLHTRLDELYHDAASAPGAVRVALTAELVDTSGRRVGERRRFALSVPTSAENAPAAVEAANRAVALVLDEIAAWASGYQAGADPRVESAGERPHLANAAAP
jgi:cholesterol transport system auxiliary component